MTDSLKKNILYIFVLSFCIWNYSFIKRLPLFLLYCTESRFKIVQQTRISFGFLRTLVFYVIFKIKTREQRRVCFKKNKNYFHVPKVRLLVKEIDFWEAREENKSANVTAFALTREIMGSQMFFYNRPNRKHLY